MNEILNPMAYPEKTIRIIRIREVKEITGLGKSTIYDLIARSEFPKALRLAPKAVGWVESEVLDWVNDRIAERDNNN